MSSFRWNYIIFMFTTNVTEEKKMHNTNKQKDDEFIMYRAK